MREIQQYKKVRFTPAARWPTFANQTISVTPALFV